MLPDPHETVWTVLHAAAKGDPSARATFAQSYSRPIRAYLRHRWQGAALQTEIEDAVQDVFVECYKPGGVLERADADRGDFRALLYGVVRNIARRYEERAAKRGHGSGGESVYLDDLPHQAEALSRVFDRSWAQSLMREAVQRHAAAVAAGEPDAQWRYQILRLRHEKGMPIREIANTIGEPDVAAVHNAYRRARREFAVHLRAVVTTHTGASDADVDEQCRRLGDLLGS